MRRQDRAVTWQIALNTTALSGGATLLAVVLAWPVALAFITAGFFLRRLLLVASVLALALPPFLLVNSWLDATRPGAWFQPLAKLSPSIVCSVLLALQLWPIALFALLSSWSGNLKSWLEIDPLLTGLELNRYLLWPLSQIPLAIAALLIWVLCLGQFSTPILLQTPVLSVAVWTRYATDLNPWAALSAGWPLILGPFVCALGIHRLPAMVLPAEEKANSNASRRAVGRGGILVCSLATLFLFLVALVLPLAQQWNAPNILVTLTSAAAAGSHALTNSLFYAATTASLTLVAAVVVHWTFLNGRRRQSPCMGAASVVLPILFFTPGMLLAVGWVQISSSLAWLAPIRSSPVLALLGLCFHYGAVAWWGTTMAFRRLDPDLIETTRLSHSSIGFQLRHVLLAQSGPVLATTWYATFLLNLWDIETMVLLHAPGGETAALRIFNLLHYGHNSQVNALCLLMLGLAILPAALWQVSAFIYSRFGKRLRWPALALCVSLTGCSPESNSHSAPVSSRIFHRVEVMGSRGTAAGQFNKPRSLTVDRADNLYVVDMTGRVQKFSPNGQFLLSWQLPQTDLGKPKGMACDADGNIVVVEPHYQRVNHFSPSGVLLKQWGHPGTNRGDLTLPRSIAVTPNGSMVLTEYTTVDRVQVFSRDAIPLLTFGEPGIGPGQFNRAESVTVDPRGFLRVADSCNHRIQVFDSSGNFLSSYGKAGTASGEMSYPYDVQVDAQGRQYVCEFGNSRIQIFGPDNQSLEQVGGYGDAPAQMSNPWSIVLDSHGSLYVADSGNHRVLKFIR